MWVFVKKELIVKILSYYEIDFDLLAMNTQAVIVYMANIFYVICLAILISMLYKMICRW